MWNLLPWKLPCNKSTVIFIQGLSLLKKESTDLYIKITHENAGHNSSNMKHNCIVSFMLYVAIICIYCRIDCVKASIVTQEVYSKHSFRQKIDTSTRRRKLIQKQGGSVRQDVCAGNISHTISN